MITNNGVNSVAILLLKAVEQKSYIVVYKVVRSLYLCMDGTLIQMSVAIQIQDMYMFCIIRNIFGMVLFLLWIHAGA